MTSQCQAISLSDERRCNAAAGGKDGLFCLFHARQCYGLYKGYKRRNLEYDILTKNPPHSLGDTPLHELDLTTFNEEGSLKELYNHLFRRYALLDRVIRARRIHHSRFYSLELDYGHEKYISQLAAERQPLTRALERVIRRTAEVLYHKQKWFKWVRKLEDDEEHERDAEKKKVKQEAALFKRHIREVESRMKQLRQKEDERRQLEFLDQAWEENRLSAAESLDEDTADESWDPVEDTIEDERGSYIDLLRHFLWQVANADTDSKEQASDKPVTDHEEDAKSMNVEEGNVDGAENSSTTSKSKNAKKKARQKANARAANPSTPANPTTPVTQVRLGEVHVESPSETRLRLETGEKYRGGLVGYTRRSINDNTVQRFDHTPPLEDDEIDRLLSEISEIKQLLFCRLLLGHASLLPAGLRANSVQEFLADDEVNNTDLRDLCLKMEQPGLQELRDACADLKRVEADEEEHEKESNSKQRYRRLLPGGPKSTIPKSFQTKREKAIKANREKIMPDDAGNFVDFGDIDDQGQYRGTKIRVKICGRYIYNYPSEKAMSRGGWLQFSVIAKDCRGTDAVALCRSWEEFYELATLIHHNYFPAGGWAMFQGGQISQQLQTLGFFTYFHVDDADEHSMRHQTGRGHDGPRQHQVVEARNYICGQMKRNDPISRRFIQYIALQTRSLVMFVRDVATGNVLAKPPEDQLWLNRVKFGLGRAVRNEWDVLTEVGPKFFEQVDQARKWSLGFKDYYEIIIWDLTPGQQFTQMCNTIQTLLFKAIRFREPADIYRPAEQILRSIRKDMVTNRARDVRPGEEYDSLWQLMTGPDSQHFLLDGPPNDDTYRAGGVPRQPMPDEWKYKEADRLEDEVLFPWEHAAQQTDTSQGAASGGDKLTKNGKHHDNNTILSAQQRGLYDFERQGPDLDRFVHDLDTDEELSDLEEPFTRLGLRSDSAAEDKDTSEEESDYDDDDWGDDDETRMKPEEAAAFDEMTNTYFDWQKGYVTERNRHSFDQAATNRQVKKLKQQEKKRYKDAMAEEMELFIDRSKAAVFKECWHNADLETGAQERWTEYLNMMSVLDKWTKRRHGEDVDAPQPELWSLMAYAYKLLIALNVEPRSHYKIVRDMISACEYTSLFFDNKTASDFLKSQPGTPFKNTLLLNQTERAKHIPDRRSPFSNTTRPKSHFKEWEAAKSKNRSGYVMDAFPESWNLTTRPIIANLYRENIISTSYEIGSSGPAISITEPDRPDKPDLFFDWRHLVPTVRLPPILQDWTKLEPLLSQAKKYFKTNKSARFSLIRIWSSPHFWPLMLGHDNRDNTSFTDGLSRHWEWKFIPKDMPASEWSIHQQNKLRLDPYRFFLNDFESAGRGKVSLCKDLYLVMGRDEEECRYLTTAVVWMINTRPWRLEVDPWKSFIDVDVGFLTGLYDKWWE